MADSLHEAVGSLQPPAMRPSSSFAAGDDVAPGSRRSSISRDGPGQSSSSNSSSLSASPSASSSREAAAATLAQPAAAAQPTPRLSSEGRAPAQLPRRDGAGRFLGSSPSSSLHDYELSPSSSVAALPAVRASHTSGHASRTASHRTRSSGTFLLPGQLGGHGKATHARPGAPPREPSARGGSSPAAYATPEKKTLPGRRDNVAAAAAAARTARAQTPDAPGPGAPAPAAASAASPASASSPAAPAGQPLDIDSAQIVSMALNLSESRRLAARRNVSQQLPPLLAPLPDSAVGGSLLRQLQQQRRISRTMSPKPERAPGSRVPSGPLPADLPPPSHSPRVSTSSALQPAFELLPDANAGGSQGAYRYHFSQSTLARAQKAKDYLELLAQHRRLLELIPPLVSEAAARSRATSLGSPPSTAAIAGQPQALFLSSSNNGELVLGATRLGRPYNPLQYIRNRKVRVRERRAIDGQAQGFGDVNKTIEWVDEVAKWAATGQGRVLGGHYTLPAFASADANAALQSSPPPVSRLPNQGVLAKPKRPRIDWIIDPADMIADVYWLEQGDNKKLVEDRHWRRVFPQDPALYRPVSQQRADEALAALRPAGDALELPGPLPTLTGPSDAPGPNLLSSLGPAAGARRRTPEDAAEADHASARKRARQKLSELRSFHHRHSSSAHNPDILRLRHGSFSDTSDSDSDWKRLTQARGESGAANSADALSKPAMDHIAEENRDRDEKAAVVAAAAAAAVAAGAANTKEANEARLQNPPGTAASLAGAALANGKKPAAAVEPSTATSLPPGTPVDSPAKGAATLEVPGVGKRLSLEYDSSRPGSPELWPFSKDDLGFVPPLGGDLSAPVSRAASPPRHRFGKVKGIFRDHSRDHSQDRSRDREIQTMLDRGEDYLDPAFSRIKTQPAQSLPHAEAHDLSGSVSAPITATTTATDDLRFSSSLEGKAPYSPLRKTGLGARAAPGTFDSHRAHSSVTGGHAHGSHHPHRSDEGGSSGGSTLRGFFKGAPRIDTMLRSGVSKVSDMLWRREGGEPAYVDTAAAPASSSSSDDDSESDAAPARGRPGRHGSAPLAGRSSSAAAENADPTTAHAPSKSGERHYLDVMPTFGLGSDPIHRPPSRQSARFERMKPPRIDVRDASPRANDAANHEKQLGEPPSSRRRNSSLQPLGRRRHQPQHGSQDSDYSESDTRSRRSSRVSAAASSVSVNMAGSGGALQPLSRPYGANAAAGQANANGERLRWSVSQPGFANGGGGGGGGALSRRELARLRASMFSSAVLAKELVRRANTPRRLAPATTDAPDADADDESGQDEGGEHDEDAEAKQSGGVGSGPIVVRGSNGAAPLTWSDIAAYAPQPAAFARRPVKQVEMYPLAAQVLGSAIQRSGVSWHHSAEAFANTTVPALRQRIESVHTRLVAELSGLARQAADEADEVTGDVMVVQRLQVKRVENSIDKMLRQRRRRFRWVRRAGWLMLEWLLVGFMWYVWFVVTLARIVLGFGRGVYTGVRWLLWL